MVGTLALRPPYDLSKPLRANGSRECAPDDRLCEAIHLTACGGMDCFVARAPRNDEVGLLIHMSNSERMCVSVLAACCARDLL